LVVAVHPRPPSGKFDKEQPMRAEFTIPFTLVEYAHWLQVDPEEYAQFVLDEKGRDLAPYIMRGRQQCVSPSVSTSRVILPRSEHRWS
jgi:hypothetical protein